MSNKLSQKSYIDRANNIHNNKYDYTKLIYNKLLDRIIIICPIHGEFTCIAGNHLRSGRECGCRGCYSESKRVHREIPNKILANLKHGAKKRGFCYEINSTIIWNQYLKQNKKCALTGVNIIFHNNHKLQTASVDRINSLKGYTIDNIQIVHKYINTFKWDLQEVELYKMCKAISDYRKDLTKINIEWEIDSWYDTVFPIQKIEQFNECKSCAS